MSGEDFVQVRLTKHGIALAGDGAVQIVSGRHHFSFRAGEILRVSKSFDWAVVLQPQSVGGTALVELVDDATSVAVEGLVAELKANGAHSVDNIFVAPNAEQK